MAHFTPSPDSFVVEELPAYQPSGEGFHTYLWIEKRELTTPEAVRRLARALAVPDRDVGYAGMKDRHATTRQWLSVPGVPSERALAVQVEGLRVLAASRHGNKLRIGHTRGNRFQVVLNEVQPGERELLAARFDHLVRAGLPNRYGAQRFGAQEDNAVVGRALLRGDRRERDGRKRRLFLSAVQSAVFNAALDLREQRAGLARVLDGDVLQKVSTGGLFVTVDPMLDQARVDAGELVITGPMPGGREVAPPAGSAAAAWEAEAMARHDVDAALFAAAGRDLPGARRALLARVDAGDPAWTDEPDPGRRRLHFSLPAGSYATVLVAALVSALDAHAAPARAC